MKRVDFKFLFYFGKNPQIKYSVNSKFSVLIISKYNIKHTEYSSYPLPMYKC